MFGVENISFDCNTRNLATSAWKNKIKGKEPNIHSKSGVKNNLAFEILLSAIMSLKF